MVSPRHIQDETEAAHLCSLFSEISNLLHLGSFLNQGPWLASKTAIGMPSVIAFSLTPDEASHVQQPTGSHPAQHFTTVTLLPLYYPQRCLSYSTFLHTMEELKSPLLKGFVCRHSLFAALDCHKGSEFWIIRDLCLAVDLSPNPGIPKILTELWTKSRASLELRASFHVRTC